MGFVGDMFMLIGDAIKRILLVAKVDEITASKVY
jgi:hypothetical protein